MTSCIFCKAGGNPARFSSLVKSAFYSMYGGLLSSGRMKISDDIWFDLAEEAVKILGRRKRYTREDVKKMRGIIHRRIYRGEIPVRIKILMDDVETRPKPFYICPTCGVIRQTILGKSDGCASWWTNYCTDSSPTTDEEDGIYRGRRTCECGRCKKVWEENASPSRREAYEKYLDKRAEEDPLINTYREQGIPFTYLFKDIEEPEKLSFEE